MTNDKKINVVDDLKKKKSDKKSIAKIIFAIIILGLVVVWFTASFMRNINSSKVDDSKKFINCEINYDNTRDTEIVEYNVFDGFLIQNSYCFNTSTDYYNVIIQYGYGNLKLIGNFNNQLIGITLDTFYYLYTIGEDDFLEYGNDSSTITLYFNNPIFIEDLEGYNNIYLETWLYEEADDLLLMSFELMYGDYSVGVQYNYNYDYGFYIENPYFTQDSYYIYIDSTYLYSFDYNLFFVSGIGQNLAYDDGFASGYQEAINNTDFDSIYNQGFLDGQKDSINQSAFKTLFNAILNAPYNIFSGLLEFEFLGVNLFSLFSFIFTTILILTLIKLFLK